MVLEAYDSVTRIVIGQLLPRFNDDGTYNDKMVVTNCELQRLIQQENTVVLWKHRGFWKDSEQLYASDKIHLNSVGMKKYVQSVRSAIGANKRFC